MSVSSRRNIDHAFPPLAPGLPSVYERAGFNVNKEAGRDNRSIHSGRGSPSIHSGWTQQTKSPVSSRRSSQGDKHYRPTQTSSLARDASAQSASTPAFPSAQDRSQLSFSSHHLDCRSLPGPESARSFDRNQSVKSLPEEHSTSSNELLDSPSRQPSNHSLSSSRSNLSGSSTSRTTRSSSSSNGVSMSSGHKMHLTKFDTTQNFTQHQDIAGAEGAPMFMSNGIPQSQSLEFTDELRGAQDRETSLHHKLAMDRYKEHGISVASLAYPANQDQHALYKSQESFDFATETHGPQSKPTSPVVAVSGSKSATGYPVQASCPAPQSPSPYPGYRGRFSGQGRSIWAPDSSLGVGATLADDSREFKYDYSLPTPTNIAMENTNRFSTTSSIYLPDSYEDTLGSVQECDEDQEVGLDGTSKRASAAAGWDSKRMSKQASEHRNTNVSGSSKRSSRSKECRGCREVIVGKSIHSKDGNLTGRWHRQCFRCIECADDLTGEVFVLDDQPYCQMCYHYANQTLCVNCEEGIEGDCLESYTEEGDDVKCRRYHPDCLACHTCSLPLRAEFYELDNKTFCNKHGSHKAQTHANVERRMTRMLLI